MRATSVLRFVVFGAVGFGFSGIIVGVLWPLAFLFSFQAAGLLFVLSGAVGGASLGLALGDRERTIHLAVLGTLGFALGGLVALAVAVGFVPAFGSLSASEDYGIRGAMGVLGGAVVGASSSLAFLDWRRTLALTLTGAVGFGVGLIVGVFALQGMFGVRFMAGTWGTVILCALAGTSGGASLGAALGSLENRKLAKQRRPRVR
ncbi:MAG: hypothetical protein M3324_10915 [Actinomycetota bacterium]|nr:hypothetical protein [Actinomycetota bacterium]